MFKDLSNILVFPIVFVDIIKFPNHSASFEKVTIRVLFYNTKTNGTYEVLDESLLVDTGRIQMRFSVTSIRI